MSDGADAVFGPLVALRETTEEVFARHGLRVVMMAVLPGRTVDGPHDLDVIAVVDGSVGTDDEFLRVIREAHAAEVGQQYQNAIAELQRRLDEGKFL